MSNIEHLPDQSVRAHFKRPTDDQQAALRASLARHYFNGKDISGEALEKDMQAHILRRYRFTCNRWIPWISRFRELRESIVVEIGCGTGSITAAFGHIAREVHGFDIDANSVIVARDRAAILGLSNTHHHCGAPERIGDLIKEHVPETADVVSLYATLEHQTFEERQTTLAIAWEATRPGGVIVIGQTPNLLTYYNPHTSRLPFFDMLPDEVKFRYLDRMPDSNFKRKMIAHRDNPKSDTAMVLTRWGRGVSFHDFEIAYGDLMNMVVANGFEPDILAFNPLQFEEKLLLSYTVEEELPIPAAFARRWLTFIIRKPDGDMDRRPVLPRIDSPYKKDL